VTQLGGTMRLGAYNCNLVAGSKAAECYGTLQVRERHRHRYEVNNSYLDQFKEKGLIATGINPEANLVEIVEYTSHPWFVAVQFHPELRSTVENPHPLFVAFVRASCHDESISKNSSTNE